MAQLVGAWLQYLRRLDSGCSASTCLAVRGVGGIPLVEVARNLILRSPVVVVVGGVTNRAPTQNLRTVVGIDLLLFLIDWYE